jgi:hypothetical protein
MDAEPPGPKRTPKQDADLRRHLKYQDSQHQGDSPINNPGFSIIFRIGLKVIREGGKLFLGGDKPTDVVWGFPLGMIVVVIGGLVCGLGLVIWGVLIMFRAIYRAIAA